MDHTAKALSGSFQSQGRFFGGCCRPVAGCDLSCPAVSIAGAILWGVLRRAGHPRRPERRVSIAGAILWGVLPNFLEKLVCHFQFQSQGRFFGGCCADPGRPSQREACFNRRGDSLGGAACRTVSPDPALFPFQSQGRFFGGCCVRPVRQTNKGGLVSIAGAILWGVLPAGNRCSRPGRRGFNRRGDSLGGAAFLCHLLVFNRSLVSIAGAILWGVLPGGRVTPQDYRNVSIAGAILWGVLLAVWVNQLNRLGVVSIAGAILWGVLRPNSN